MRPNPKIGKARAWILVLGPVFFALSLCSCQSVGSRQLISGAAGVVPTVWEVPIKAIPTTLSLVELVHNKQIRALVKHAGRVNLDLRQTAVRYEESRALLGLPRAARLPALDWTASSARRDDGENDVGSSVSSGFRLSWELDLWGRLADQAKAAQLEYRALYHDLRGARNSLAARVTKLALESSFRQESLTLQERRRASLAANLGTIQGRFERGLGTLTDKDLAASALASAEATRRQLEEDIERTRRNLAEELANPQLSLLKLPRKLTFVTKPVPDVPAQILVKRPDVAAAFDRVVATQFTASASFKDLLPSFSLAGNLDQGGINLSEALKADPVWFLVGNITVPLIDGGRRRSQLEADRLAAKRAGLAYRETLVKAVVEVENFLGLERMLSSQLNSLELAAKHALQNRSSVEERYKRGLTDILNLLTAQQTSYDANQRLLKARYQCAVNRIDIGLAMGLDTTP